MKAIWRFVGTTILGGVLFLTPIVVLGIVLSKAYDFVRRGLQPLTALTAQTLAPGPTMTAILAILVLALMCLLAGLFARTMLAQRIVNGLEATVRWPTKAATPPIGFAMNYARPGNSSTISEDQMMVVETVPRNLSLSSEFPC